MTLAEITTAVLAIVADYDVYIGAALVFGLGIFAAKRLFKGLR